MRATASPPPLEGVPHDVEYVLDTLLARVRESDPSASLDVLTDLARPTRGGEVEDEYRVEVFLHGRSEVVDVVVEEATVADVGVGDEEHRWIMVGRRSRELPTPSHHDPYEAARAVAADLVATPVGLALSNEEVRRVRRVLDAYSVEDVRPDLRPYVDAGAEDDRSLEAAALGLVDDLLSGVPLEWALRRADATDLAVRR